MAPLDMTDKTFPSWPDVAAQLVEVAAGRRAADTIITGGILFVFVLLQRAIKGRR